MLNRLKLHYSSVCVLSLKQCPDCMGAYRCSSVLSLYVFHLKSSFHASRARLAPPESLCHFLIWSGGERKLWRGVCPVKFLWTVRYYQHRLPGWLGVKKNFKKLQDAGERSLNCLKAWNQTWHWLLKLQASWRLMFVDWHLHVWVFYAPNCPNLCKRSKGSWQFVEFAVLFFFLFYWTVIRNQKPDSQPRALCYGPVSRWLLYVTALTDEWGFLLPAPAVGFNRTGWPDTAHHGNSKEEFIKPSS